MRITSGWMFNHTYFLHPLANDGFTLPIATDVTKNLNRQLVERPHRPDSGKEM